MCVPFVHMFEELEGLRKVTKVSLGNGANIPSGVRRLVNPGSEAAAYMVWSSGCLYGAWTGS